MAFLDTKYKRKSAVYTTVIGVLILIIMFVFGLTYFDPPIEYGIAVNFGTSDVGSGNVQPTEALKPATTSESEPEPVEEVEEAVEEEVTEESEAVAESETNDASEPAESEEVITQESAEALAIKKAEEERRIREAREKEEARKKAEAERKAEEERQRKIREENERKERERKAQEAVLVVPSFFAYIG